MQHLLSAVKRIGIHICIAIILSQYRHDIHIIIFSHLFAGAAGTAFVLKSHRFVKMAGGVVAGIIVQIDPVKSILFKGSVKNPFESLASKTLVPLGWIADVNSIDLYSPVFRRFAFL